MLICYVKHIMYASVNNIILKGLVMSKAKTVKGDTTKEAANTVVSKDSLYTSTKAINDAVTKAVSATMETQLEWQRILCSAIQHLATHKDIRVIRNIRTNAPEGLRKASMDAFIDKFAPVTFDDKSEVHYNAERKLDLHGAMNLPWWKAAKETPYVPVNDKQELGKFISRMEKRFAKANPELGDHISIAFINDLKAIYNRMPDVAENVETEQQNAA